MVRAQTIGWGRSGAEEPKGGPPLTPSPWAGRALGILLLALALVAIYHGSAGQAVWRELSGYVAGTRSVEAPAVTRVTLRTATGPASIAYGTGTTADALASAAADTQAALADVGAGDFRAGDAALTHLSQTWLTLSGGLAESGVPIVDINDFTATLSDAESEAATGNGTLARADMTRLASEMNVLAFAYVSREAPTFSELKNLAMDLSAGVQQKNWGRVSSDSRALSDLVQTIQQGY